MITGETTLRIIETGLTLITILMAFALPRFGSPAFHTFEAWAARLAGRRSLAVFLVGLSAPVSKQAAPQKTHQRIVSRAANQRARQGRKGEAAEIPNVPKAVDPNEVRPSTQIAHGERVVSA